MCAFVQLKNLMQMLYNHSLHNKSMFPRLYISDYYKDGTDDDIGETARFRVYPWAKGVILQEVHHRTKQAGERTVTRRFYECWTVSAKGRISPAPTDSFFIPCSYGEKAGHVTVRAKAWFLPCSPKLVRAQLSLEDTDNAVSGVLPSQNGTVPPAYHRRGIHRYWHAEWKAAEGGPTCMQVTSRRHSEY